MKPNLRHLACTTGGVRMARRVLQRAPMVSLQPPLDRIERAIFLLRGHRVLLDTTLAELYGVTTKALNQAVRRNVTRFPEDFMFQLTPDEAERSRSQFVTLNVPASERASRRGTNLKYLPNAFTEQGVAMLSSVLRSERAVQVNIEIMRTFVRLRALLASNTELRAKLDALERKYDGQFRMVFEAIRELMNSPSKSGRRIGFES